MLRVTRPIGASDGDRAALEDLAAELAEAPAFGLDTEFLRERTYRAQLCLLQLASPARAVCVDPLGPVSLEPLRPAFAGPSLKIMHAARQDLEVLWPVFGAPPRIFDTQVAAALCGSPAQVGYGELVRRLLGVELEKAHTRTDWSRRPLSAAQVEYALDDVAWLAPLHEALAERLDRLGRTAWMEEEMRGLGDPADLFVAPENAWQRLKGVTELDPFRQSLIRALAAWRERRAADRDRPRSWILPDNVLRAIALRVPRDTAQLAALPDMAPGFVENSGAEILALIEELSPPARLPDLPPRPRPDPALVARVKRLADVARAVATELGIVPELLATRRDLEALARGADDVPPLQGWRGECLGARLRAVV